MRAVASGPRSPMTDAPAAPKDQAHDQDADPPLTDGEGPDGPHPDPAPGEGHDGATGTMEA